MSLESVIEAVFGIDHQLEHHEVKKLVQLGELVTVDDGTVIIREGESAACFYIVLSGQVDICAPIDEPEIKLYSANQHDIVGWSSLVPPRIYTGNAVAPRQCQLLRFDADHLLGMMQQDFRLGYIIMSKVAQFLSQRLLTSAFDIMVQQQL